MITVPSFAKVNLHLRILEREASGYHLLETVLQTIDLRDELTFETIRRARLEVESDLAPEGPANIVHRAASLLLPAGRGLRVRVRKRIPIGAGLGGGSGNAAVTLLAVNSLFRLGRKYKDLSRMAESLGADVPFFLVGGTAVGTHYGEKVWPLADAPASRVTLLFPGVEISTAQAYGNLTLTKKSPLCTIQSFCYALLNQRVDALEAAMSNDFERAIFRNPRVAGGVRLLKRAGFSRVHLSGSGSALFALGSPTLRVEAIDGCRVWSTEFLSRNRYRRSLGRFLDLPAS